MTLMDKLPFERNRYYYGKMLTTPDFRAEQMYMNHKREFLNRVVLGTGVLCGLGVHNLDDLSILVESGAAIDPSGREIVVDSPVVTGLSALEGYREDAEVLSLCLRFRERETQPVYAVNRKEDQQEYENNRIVEEYELFLKERENTKAAVESEFFVETELACDKDYRVILRMPAYVCKGRMVKISIEAEKLSARQQMFAFECEMQMPLFQAKDGERKLFISETQQPFCKGEKRKWEYWINTDYTDVNETSIVVKKKRSEDIEIPLFLADESPETLIGRVLGTPGLEIRQADQNGEYVSLADVYLTHTKCACVISRIEETAVKKYILVPADEEKRTEYRGFYGETCEIHELSKKQSLPVSCEDKDKKKRDAVDEGNNKDAGSVQNLPVMSGGTLEIALDQKMKKNAVCFSEEISHGLGPGSVYVAVGVDIPEEGAHVVKKTRSTIYGDADLFSREKGAAAVRTAVEVCEERGSFRAAVQFVGEQNTVLLSMHWIAVRLPEERRQASAKEMYEGEPELVPESVTVELRPREKHFFNVKFKNMDPCVLRYELTEDKSGKINEDGTYTAPLKTGVYEICISCRDNPQICTYVYAVVGGSADRQEAGK